MKPFTQTQAAVGSMHRIPMDQWSTVNIQKFWDYIKWKRTPAARVERILDEIDMARGRQS